MNSPQNNRREIAYELRNESAWVGYLAALVLVVVTNLLFLTTPFIIALPLAILAVILWGVLSMKALRRKTDRFVNELATVPGDILSLVREFHETYGVPIRSYPSLNIPDKQLIVDLIEEEVEELKQAIANGDIVEVFDALLDISWVTLSGTIKIGLPFVPGIEEVARSNRSKLGLDGLPIYSDTNKVLKGPNFTPPNLQKVLDASQRNSKSR